MSRSERTAIDPDYQRLRRTPFGRPDLPLGITPAGRTTAAARSFDLYLALDLLALGEQRIDLLAQLLEAFEALVDAGESNVCDLVELAQLVHRHLADICGRHVRKSARTERSLDL